MRKLNQIVILSAVAIFTAGSSGNVSAHVTECDWVSGHPTDPGRQAPGLSTSQINWRGAVYACERDLAADPNNAHLQYLMGHLLYYKHDWQDWPRSLELIRSAANQGYAQAHFALGNFYAGGELGALLPQDYCKSAEHHLFAARWGRYASLISYSRFAVKGMFDNCTAQVDWQEVEGFLTLARGAAQHDWYDGLFVTDLEELLAVKRAE